MSTNCLLAWVFKVASGISHLLAVLEVVPTFVFIMIEIYVSCCDRPLAETGGAMLLGNSVHFENSSINEVLLKISRSEAHQETGVFLPSLVS
jgi:hypothetical protein